ncbi:hypothetical protein BJX68DRAFT_268156 [Aspergillus pseudodeflectus]|uniref:Uncharacterized protein n=1 Tax=Aspergillus pseudodeflectus TaxID=176178 RepID=A0ABR4K4N9_9EURO
MSSDTSRAGTPTEDSNSFTPINSPKGRELDAAMKAKQEEQDENLSTSAAQSQNVKEAKSSPAKKPGTTPAKGSGASSTPSKRARKTAGDTTTPTKRARKDSTGSPSTKGASPRKAALPPVPSSLAEAGTEDKMILNLRDVEGKSWGEITKLFISVTGIQVGGTTLRLRHAAMKAKFVEIPDEDATRLLRLKKEIEDKFESEKWARISEAIVTDGGGKYPTATLQKKFKQLDKDGVSAASIAAVTASTGAVNNVNGGDDGEEDEDEE